MILTATVSEIFGGQTNSSILVVQIINKEQKQKNKPVDHEVVELGEFVTDRAQPRWLPLVHSQVAPCVETLQVVARVRSTRRRDSRLTQLKCMY